jgi:hypothetical protein
MPPAPRRLPGASFQKKSSNSKLSHVLTRPHANGRMQTFPQAPFVCSTYVSISATCPSTCKFKDAGCYVQTGNALGPMKRLDAEARGRHVSRITVARNEAELIDLQWSSDFFRSARVPQDGARGGRDLRLHVGGDVVGPLHASWLGAAAERWRLRGGGRVWTYTHRWSEVAPCEWGPAIAALASVESPEEAEAAVDLGYSPAWTVAAFRDVRAHSMSGIKLIPCPAQTRGVKCIECRLCLRPLPKGAAIGFAFHGQGHKMAGKRRLDVIDREMRGQERLAL